MCARAHAHTHTHTHQKDKRWAISGMWVWRCSICFSIPVSSFSHLSHQFQESHLFNVLPCGSYGRMYVYVHFPFHVILWVKRKNHLFTVRVIIYDGVTIHDGIIVHVSVIVSGVAFSHPLPLCNSKIGTSMQPRSNDL